MRLYLKIMLFIVCIFMSINSGYAMSVDTTVISDNIPISTSTELVPVAPYYTANLSYSNPLTRGPDFEFINIGHDTRIRQTGNITKVKFSVDNVHVITNFVIKVYTVNDSEYIVRSISENLAPVLVNGTNEINLSVPLYAVEGDYYGVYFNQSDSTTFILETISRTGTTYAYKKPSSNPTEGSTLSNLTGNSSNKFYPVILYMTAPVVVSIGDSTTAGHPSHHTFIETTKITNLSSQTIRNLAVHNSSITYQNMGIGGQNASQIRARFESDVIALHPQYAIIETGLNEGDAILQLSTQQSILEDIEEMVQLCIANNITPVVFEVPPMTADTAEKTVARSNITDGIYDLQKTYNFMVFNNRDVVGNYNEISGVWEIKPEYNCGDNVHYNVAGYTALGNALYSRMCGNTYVQGVEVSVNGNFITASSNTSNTVVSFSLSDLPANRVMSVYRDNQAYDTIASDSNGHAIWVYSGGFSEHVFEIIPIATTEIRNSFVSSWGNTVSMVGAIIVISLAGSMIAVFRGKREVTDLVNDLPGIVLIVVLLVTGAIIFGQF